MRDYVDNELPLIVKTTVVNLASQKKSPHVPVGEVHGN